MQIQQKSKQSLSSAEIQQKRKSEVALLLYQFLDNAKLKKTLQALKLQAPALNKRKTIQQFIQVIQNDQRLSIIQKQNKIIDQLASRYYKQVQNRNDEVALYLLNKIMPKYFKQAQLQHFAQNIILKKISPDSIQKKEKKQGCLLSKMFAHYFSIQTASDPHLPNHKSLTYHSPNQIWLIKCFSNHILCLDQHSGIYLFNHKLILLNHKQKIDQNITNIKWRNQTQFVTCSNNHLCMWNLKLQLVQKWDYHQGNLNTFCFGTFNNQEIIISGGFDQFIMINKIKSSKLSSVTKLKYKGAAVRDIKYHFTNDTFIVLVQEKSATSTIKVYTPQQIKCAQIKTNQRFLDMEISEKQSILHLVSEKGKIVNYSLKDYKKLSQFQNQHSGKYIIRMQKGGYNNQYLAMGNQNGQILFFHDGQRKSVKKLYSGQKTVVNCVSWITPQILVCGCDNGNIQLWKYQNLGSKKQNQMQNEIQQIIQ